MIRKYAVGRGEGFAVCHGGTPTVRGGEACLAEWPVVSASFKIGVRYSRSPALVAAMLKHFFRDLSEHRIRRDCFIGAPELEPAIDLCAAHHDANSKPFICTEGANGNLGTSTGAKTALAMFIIRFAHGTR